MAPDAVPTNEGNSVAYVSSAEIGLPENGKAKLGGSARSIDIGEQTPTD